MEEPCAIVKVSEPRGLWKLSSGGMFAIFLSFVLICVAFYIQTSVRIGWTSRKATVVSASCTRKKRTSGSSRHRFLYHINACDISIDLDRDGNATTAPEDAFSLYSEHRTLSYKQGDTVTVYYDPDDFSTTATLSSFTRTHWAVGLYVVGLLAMIVGVVIFRLPNTSTAEHAMPRSF